MVASASIGVSERALGTPFHFFQRQLATSCLGLVAAAVAVSIPTTVWDKYSKVLMGAAFLLLLVVLVPGIGYEVNGSRRWVRLGIMNFQVSELARVLLLTYIASYAVRRADERAPASRFRQARGWCWARRRCCCCSSRTSAPPPC